MTDVGYINRLGPSTSTAVKMKYGRSYTRTKTSRRRRRRGGRRRRFRGVPRVQALTVTRKLKCVWYNSLNPAAGSLSEMLLSLNSAYDPTGNVSPNLQLLAFDQYEALYSRYVVTASKVTIDVVAPSENTAPIVVGICPTIDATARTDSLHYSELPGNVFRILTPDGDHQVFSAYYRIKPWLLPKGKMLTDDTVSAAVTGDPARLLYGHVYAQAQDHTSDPGQVNFTITQTMWVTFYNRKQPARSTQ